MSNRASFVPAWTMTKLGSLHCNGMTWCFMSSTVAPQKLCTLTTRLFLLNRSCMISFKMECPIVTAAPSGYFSCVSPLLFVTYYWLIIFVARVFEYVEFFFFFLFTSSSWFSIDFLSILSFILFFFVGNKNFVIGICYFIIVDINIFISNWIIYWY